MAVDKQTLVKTIIEAMQEKKGHDIAYVDLTAIEEAATGGFVIATGNSPMQVEAVADSVREYVEKHIGVRPFNYDGYQNAEWVVIDYGMVFAHVFLGDMRQRYDLEHLWSDAKLTLVPDIY